MRLRPSLPPSGVGGDTQTVDGVPFAPKFKWPAKSRPVFISFVKQIAASLRDDEEQTSEVLALLRQRVEREQQKWPSRDRTALAASLHLALDLAQQGWTLRATPAGVHILRPAEAFDDPLAEKARVRRQELLKRAEQLSQSATQEFVRAMETRRLFRDKHVSVLSLLRDGRVLAQRLREVAQKNSTDALDAVVSPYLQFVDDKATCEWTGLRLQDVWRYFRHTWANQYVSVPGRTMMFLIRDAAAPMHPIMGIGALSSPVVQIRERDFWVGWHPASFLDRVRQEPRVNIARWLQDTVDSAIREMYLEDLVDEVITRARLKSPTDETISKLLKYGRKQREAHNRLMSSKDYKRPSQSARSAPDYWLKQALTPLFKSKRALVLADLLRCQIVLRKFFGARPSLSGLKKLAADEDGATVVTRVLRKAKGDRVGILMADISVCGAVQPYNPLLGGKLAAMLATSPEVVTAYRTRYADAVSEIASSMKGEPVVRAPDLVFLGTTSLYGAGSSQYNRIAIPCERGGGDPGTFIRFHETGRSEAFGTSHFSNATLDALGTLVAQTTRGQQVHYVFGEGASPKMRNVRQGLEALGLSSDLFLRHGRRRVVYCVPLVSNYRDFLVGLDAKPKYLIPPINARRGSDGIAQWWRERWFRARALKPEVLEQIEAHTLTYPITHGAKVMLPPVDSEQRSLSL